MRLMNFLFQIRSTSVSRRIVSNGDVREARVDESDKASGEEKDEEAGTRFGIVGKWEKGRGGRGSERNKGGSGDRGPGGFAIGLQLLGVRNIFRESRANGQSRARAQKQGKKKRVRSVRSRFSVVGDLEETHEDTRR